MIKASSVPAGDSRRERWLVTGLISSLALAGYLAFGPSRSPHAAPAAIVATPSSAGPSAVAPTASASPRLPAAEPARGCYLGVVLVDESVDVVAEVEGHVREVLVRPGDAVERGTPLVVLDNPSLDHQLTIELGSLALIEAEVKSFTVQFERSDRLHRRRLGLEGLLSREEADTSEVQLELARYRLDVAYAELTQARARIAQLEANLERRTIRAPFSGTVAMRYLDRGAVAARGTPVLRLISGDASRVRFAVPPAASGESMVGARVRVEIESLGRSLSGVVEQRAPEIDAASEMIFVESRLDPGGPPIPPGAVARVSLIGPAEASAPSCLDPSPEGA